MGGFSNCCCGGVDCSDRSVLPETFEIDFGAIGTTIINRADWTAGGTELEITCCWSYTITTVFAIREYECSNEIPYSYSQGQKLVSYRSLNRTIITLSTGSSQCDSQPGSTDQYVVTVQNEYVGKVGIVVYDYPSLSCDVLSGGLDGIFGTGASFTQKIMRAKYFASLIADTYTLTPSDLSDCVPACVALDSSQNSLTITDIPTGLSITWDNSNNWDFVTT